MTIPDGAVHGIWPILYAFFDAEGGLDREAMRRQVQACVAAGANGVAALGLATEVAKLSPDERRTVMRWLAEDLAGRLPFAITVFGETVDVQAAFVREAAALGAGWVILQPPPTRPMPEDDLVRFFGAVADRSPVPVAIQNAPQYIGVGLGTEALGRLMAEHRNVRLLKGEASALEIGLQIEALRRAGNEVTVLNGRGGLELPDILRAGCAGLIPAPETVDVHVAIYAAMRRGDGAEADRLYASVLPLTVFTMQSIPQLICYGKRALARRLGITTVFDREPCQRPTAAGLMALERHAGHLPLLLPG